MDKRGSNDGQVGKGNRGKGVQGRLIRGREREKEGVGTSCSAERKVGRIKRRVEETHRRYCRSKGARVRERGERSRPTQVNRASLNRKVGSIYGLQVNYTLTPLHHRPGPPAPSTSALFSPPLRVTNVRSSDRYRSFVFHRGIPLLSLVHACSTALTDCHVRIPPCDNSRLFRLIAKFRLRIILKLAGDKMC